MGCEMFNIINLNLTTSEVFGNQQLKYLFNKGCKNRELIPSIEIKFFADSFTQLMGMPTVYSLLVYSVGLLNRKDGE